MKLEQIWLLLQRLEEHLIPRQLKFLHYLLLPAESRIVLLVLVLQGLVEEAVYNTTNNKGEKTSPDTLLET